MGRHTERIPNTISEMPRILPRFSTEVLSDSLPTALKSDIELESVADSIEEFVGLLLLLSRLRGGRSMLATGDSTRVREAARASEKTLSALSSLGMGERKTAPRSTGSACSENASEIADRARRVSSSRGLASLKSFRPRLDPEGAAVTIIESSSPLLPANPASAIAQSLGSRQLFVLAPGPRSLEPSLPMPSPYLGSGATSSARAIKMDRSDRKRDSRALSGSADAKRAAFVRLSSARSARAAMRAAGAPARKRERSVGDEGAARREQMGNQNRVAGRPWVRLV